MKACGVGTKAEAKLQEWWNMVTAANPSTQKIEARLSFSMRIFVKQMGFGGSYEAWGNYRRNPIFFKVLQQALFLIFFFSFW